MIKMLSATVFAIPVLFAAHTALAEGSVSGFECAGAPQPEAVSIEILDDSREMLELRKVLLDALASSKRAVSASSPFVLTLETEETHVVGERKGRDLIEISEGTDEDTRFHMNLWSNKRDSVLGGRKDGVTAEPQGTIKVLVAIHERSNGRCVWRGEAVHDTTDRDQWLVAAKMVPHIVGLIGKTVTDRAIHVD